MQERLVRWVPCPACWPVISRNADLAGGRGQYCRLAHCCLPAVRAVPVLCLLCSEMQEREGRLSEELAQAQANLGMLRRLHQASQNQLFRCGAGELGRGWHLNLLLLMRQRTALRICSL
jgi:hypothetical protein